MFAEKYLNAAWSNIENRPISKPPTATARIAADAAQTPLKCAAAGKIGSPRGAGEPSDFATSPK